MHHFSTKTLMAATLALGVGTSASAAWTTLDNFDADATGPTTTATGGDWTSVFDGTGNSNIVATDKGQSLETRGGTAWRGAERDLTGTSAAVLVGETQTFFWQVKAFDNSGAYTGTGNFYDFMMGLSPDVSNIDTNNAWQDFSVMPFINNAAATPFINADAPTEPWWAPMNPDAWYDVWLVINNDAVDPTFDLHYSVEGGAPILVASDANWRNFAPGVDLNAIGFMAAGNAESRFYIDNIAYASGENLTNPIPEPGSLALLGLGGLLIARRRRD